MAPARMLAPVRIPDIHNPVFLLSARRALLIACASCATLGWATLGWATLGWATLGCGSGPVPTSPPAPYEPPGSGSHPDRDATAGASSSSSLSDAPSSSTPEAVLAAKQEMQACFAHRAGCTVLYSDEHGWIESEESACQARFLPCSTYKIPHSLIGLETEVLADADTSLAWDPAAYPREPWWPDAWSGQHDLRSAFRASVVPYYRKLATLVGPARMQHYLDGFDYGNRDQGDSPDSFWLVGPLAISAREQIEFLRKLDDAALPVSARSLSIVKDVMVAEEQDTAVLRAKTGMGTLPEGRQIGWYVGYVTRPEGRWFFATNVLGETFDDVREERIEISRSVLAAAGAFPTAATRCTAQPPGPDAGSPDAPSSNTVTSSP